MSFIGGGLAKIAGHRRDVVTTSSRQEKVRHVIQEKYHSIFFLCFSFPPGYSQIRKTGIGNFKKNEQLVSALVDRIPQGLC